MRTAETSTGDELANPSGCEFYTANLRRTAVELWRSGEISRWNSGCLLAEDKKKLTEKVLKKNLI